MKWLFRFAAKHLQARKVRNDRSFIREVARAMRVHAGLPDHPGLRDA